MKMKSVHFFVSGRVQGVCYRHYAAKKAKELGLKGFVKNTPDERVELRVEGEEAKLNAFLIFCKNNPGYSSVEEIEIEEERKIKKSSFKSFEIL
jgi:acylphosphatase